MGSATLWRLARRGFDVVGVEQFEPGHSRGASHGRSRIIRTAYAEGARYVPLALQAWRLWDELSEVAEVSLVERTGGLILAPEGSAPIKAPVVSAEAHHLKYEMLSAADIRHRFPQHLVGEEMVGFYEEDAGVVMAEEAVLAAVRAARTCGAEVISGTEVRHIIADEQRPAVLVGDSKITARHVVVAAGGWITLLLPEMATKIEVVRRQFAWFAADKPEAFAPAKFPIFIRCDATGDYNWYGFPCLDGHTVKVGIHAWPGIDELVNPAAGAREPDERDSDLFERLIGEVLSGVEARPARIQSCMYSKTADRNFLVGPVAGFPGLTVLGGFSGHGFKFAPVLGDIAADLATTGKTRWDIGIFDPNR